LNNKWTYIDKTGAILLENKLDWAGDFHYGYARVKEVGQWGYINKTGNFVIKPKYRHAEDFILLTNK
jgi:hypothetical protein